MTAIFDFDAIAEAMRRLREPEPEAKPECDQCGGGGWECYGLGFADPNFRECSICHNPEGLPSS